jgi:hypothetical protein
MINNVYYLGFEGEPEIQFTMKGNNEDYTLSIWEGYFDRIMSLIKPDVTGWTGIAYLYHMHIGWYDEDMWAIQDTVDAYNKFKSIPKEKLDENSSNVLFYICQLFSEAVKNDYKVFINRD